MILGVSAGTGAAIASAVARDPGLDIYGVHRGKHPAGAAVVEADAAAAGARAVIRTSDAGTAEGAMLGAADLQRAAWLNGATIDFTGGMTQSLLDVVINP